MGGNRILLEDLSFKRRRYKVKQMTNKYVVTMTNPLACGHDGTWETDLLMECHPGIRPETTPTNGDCGSTSSSTSCVPPPREDSGSVRTGGGGGGGGVVGESSSGGGASVTRRNESPSRATDTGDGNGSREQEKKGQEKEAAASSGDEQLISDDDLELSDSSDEVDGAGKGIASKGNRAQHEEIAEREKMARAGAEGEIDTASDVCLSKPKPLTESGTRELPASSSASTVCKTLKGSVRSTDNFAIPEKTFLTPPQANPSSPASIKSPTATGRLTADFGSPGSLTSLGDSGEDDVGSDSSFDESEERPEGSSEEDMEDDDSYEVDVVFPPCSIIHKDRKTFKYSLCEECYKKYKADLERAGGSISDVDSNTGWRKRKKRARQRGELVPREAPAGDKDAMEESPNRLRTSAGESKSVSRPRKRRRKTVCVQLELEGSLMIESKKARTGRKGKMKAPSWAKVQQAKDRCHKQVIGESSQDARWPIKDLNRNSIGGSVGGYRVGGSGRSMCQFPGRLKRESEGLVKLSPKCEDIRGGIPTVSSAAKTKPQGSTAGNAMRASNSGQKPRKEVFGTVPRDKFRAEASKAVLLSPPLEKSRGRTAGALNVTLPQRPGLKRALSSDSGGVALAGRSSTANGGAARYRREVSFDSSILDSKAVTASAPRPTADASQRPPSTAAPRPATRVPPRPAWTATPRPAVTTSARPAVTAAPRSIAVPRRPVITKSGSDEVSSLVAKALMPLKSGPTIDAGMVTSGSRPAGHSRGYEKTPFPGANDKLYDGKAYDSADACVREYTRLTNSPRGNQSGLGKNIGIGEATAPSRPGTPDLSALSFNTSGVSLTAKKAPSSGSEKKPPLAKPKKMPFSLFGTKSSLDPSVQQARAVPESREEICPNIDGRIVRRSPLPLPYVPSYSEGTTGAIRWSPDGPMGRPVNGLHVPCNPNVLPKRSGTKGGRKGRAPPDTRAKCAERGTSAKYLDSDEETRGEVKTALSSQKSEVTKTGLSQTPEASEVGVLSCLETETPTAVTIESVTQSGNRHAAGASNDGGVVASNTGGTTEGSEVVARADSCSKNVGTRECASAVDKRRLNTPERKVTHNAVQGSSGAPPVAPHSCADSGGTAGGENREGGSDHGRTGDAADGGSRAKERAEGNGRRDMGYSSRDEPNTPTETNHDQVRINADETRSQLRANAANSVPVAKNPINLVQMRNDSATNVIQSTNKATIPVHMQRNEAENVVQLRDNAVNSVAQIISLSDRLLQMQNNAGGNPIHMRNCTANDSASILDNVANPPVEIQNAADPVLIRNSGDNNTIQMRDNRINSPKGHTQSPWRQTMAKDESREEQGREILQSMLMGRRTGEERVDRENGPCFHASESKPSANRTSLFPESISRGIVNVRPAVTDHKDGAWEVKANGTGVLEDSDVDDADDARKAIKADIDKLLDDFKKRADQALGDKAPTQRSEAAVNAQLSRASSPLDSPGKRGVSDARHDATSSCDEEINCDARHAPTSIAYPDQSSQVAWQRPWRISREIDTGEAVSESTAGRLVPWVPPRRLGKPAVRNMPAEDRSAGVDSTAEERESTSLSISPSSACDNVEAQDNSRPCTSGTFTEGVHQVSWRTPSRLGSVRRGHTVFRQNSPNEVGAQIPADDETQGVSTAQAPSASTETPQVPWKQPCRLASAAQRSHATTPSVSLISTELLIDGHSQEEDAEEEIIQDASLRMGHVEGSPRETDDSTVDQFELLLQRSRLEYPARDEDETEKVNGHASATAHTYRDAPPLKANEHAKKQGDAMRVKKEPKDTETSKGDRARDNLQCDRAVDEHVSVDKTRNQEKESAQIKEECQVSMLSKDGSANGFLLSGGAMDEHRSVGAAPPKAKGHTTKHAQSKQERCEGTGDTSGCLADESQTRGAVGIQESANTVPWKPQNGAGKGDDVARSMEKRNNLTVKKGGGTEGISPRNAAVGAPGLKKGNNGICIGGSFVSRRRRDSSSPSSRAGSRSGSLDRSSNSSFSHRRGRDDMERPRNRERHNTSSSRRRRDVGHRSRESPEGKSFRKEGERYYERADLGRKTREGSKGRGERRKRESSRRRASSSEEDRKSPHDNDRCDWSGRRRCTRSRSPQRDIWRRKI